MNDKGKLCFIIPEYDRETPTHFSYLYDFIEKISEGFDIFLIAERGRGNPPKGVNRFYIQKFQHPVLRVLENEIMIERARLAGYKTFYVHYSFLSAYHASIITRFWGGEVFYWNCGEPWKYKRGLIRNLFERAVYKLVHFLVTGTEGLKKKYAEYYGLSSEKIKVMSNWIDVSKIFRSATDVRIDLKISLDIPATSKVILFVHRLSKRKGAHYLPEILNELKDENAVMVIIGDGPERKDIESRVKNYELWSRARFCGWVPQKDLARYFSIADVFIMPSDEEGFPHVLLEAMAYGVPFAAFDVGGVREIIPDQALEYVTPSGDVKLFAKKAIFFLSMPPESRTNLKEVLKKHVLNYDINLVVRHFQVMTNSLV